MIDRGNNFDTLRFCAALAVIWSHAFSATRIGEIWEPFMVLSGGQTTLGTIAVAVFFVISGYLITQSFERSRSAWRFAKARVLRLMPALLIVLLLLGVVVGPIVTVLPLAEYFGDRELYRYMFLNGSLLGYAGLLPGVFVDNPVPYVNGPLWTLRFEAACYVMIFVLGILGLLNRYVTLGLFLAGLAFLAFDGPYVIDDFLQWNHRIDLTTKFLAGAVIYHWSPRLSGSVALACIGVSVLTLLFGGFWLVLPTLFAYVVIYVAFAPVQLPNMARFGDLSYGLYIYGWPVKQLIVYYGLASSWYTVGALATVVSLALAFLSWHLVEKIALSFKDRMVPGERRLSELLDGTVASLRTALAVPTPKIDNK